MSIDQDTSDETAFVDRLAGAFRGAPLGMAVLAPNGTFLRANPVLCRLVGRSEDDLRRIGLADVVDDERVAAWREARPRTVLAAAATCPYRGVSIRCSKRHVLGGQTWSGPSAGSASG
jgi:PAS domain-containing protein